MKLPVVSGKEVIRALKKLGFSIDRQKGSHVQMVKIIEGEERLVTVTRQLYNPLNAIFQL